MGTDPLEVVMANNILHNIVFQNMQMRLFFCIRTGIILCIFKEFLCTSSTIHI